MVDGTYSISSLGRRYYYLVLIHSRAGSSSRFKLQAFEKDRLIQPLFDYPYPNTTSQSKSNGGGPQARRGGLRLANGLCYRCCYGNWAGCLAGVPGCCARESETATTPGGVSQ